VVEYALGEKKVAQEPLRIVVLHPSLVTVALSLGVEPAAAPSSVAGGGGDFSECLGQEVEGIESVGTA
jgi:ABC-type Fe3+-hydroxamate transport system substrate-binding protein